MRRAFMPKWHFCELTTSTGYVPSFDRGSLGLWPIDLSTKLAAAFESLRVLSRRYKSLAEYSTSLGEGYRDKARDVEHISLDLAAGHRCPSASFQFHGARARTAYAPLGFIAALIP
jgi:hypothetical protein